MSEAKAVGILELNISGFTAALDTAKRALAVFGVSFAAFKTGDFWVQHIKGAIEFGNAMYVAGQKMGQFDPGKLYLIQKAFQQTGISAEEANSQIQEMLNSHRDFSTFFRGGAPEFGKALQTAKKNYGPQANTLSAHAEDFAKVEQTIQAILAKSQQFFLIMSSKFLQPLNSLLNALNAVDFSGIADTLGNAIDRVANTLIGLFASGHLTEAFTLGLQVASQTAVNYLVGGLEQAGRTFGDVIAAIFNTSFADGLGNIFIGIAERFGAAIVNALQKPIAMFQAVLAYPDAHKQAVTDAKNFAGNVREAMDLADKHARAAQNFEAHGNTKAANREWTTSAGFRAAEEASNKQLKDALATQNMGLGDYVGAHANDAVSFFGKSTADVDQKGQDDISKGAAELVPQAQNAFEAFKKSFADFKPADLFSDLPGASKKLADMLAKAQSLGLELGKPVDSMVKGFTSTMGAAHPVHIIADSLARVGGGGGYARASVSIAERAAMQTAENTRQQNLLQSATNSHLMQLNSTLQKGGGGGQPMHRG